MARTLTERQQKFLDVLFDEAAGDVVLAKKLAGYSESTATSHVVDALKEEIADRTRSFFARTAPKAAVSMANAIIDPTELGIKEKMVAAKDILDRSGFTKTDKVEVTAASPLFILPPKNDEND